MFCSYLKPLYWEFSVYIYTSIFNLIIICNFLSWDIRLLMDMELVKFCFQSVGCLFGETYEKEEEKIVGFLRNGRHPCFPGKHGPLNQLCRIHMDSQRLKQQSWGLACLCQNQVLSMYVMAFSLVFFVGLLTVGSGVPLTVFKICSWHPFPPIGLLYPALVWWLFLVLVPQVLSCLVLVSWKPVS